MTGPENRRWVGSHINQQGGPDDGPWSQGAVSLAGFSIGPNIGGPVPGAISQPSLANYRQIVFIEGDVPNAHQLAAGVTAGTLAVILNANGDGVAQIAAFLARFDISDLAAIDIVTHGADGTVQLGTGILTSASLERYQSDLAAVGAALRPGGVIQIYGCDVAQDAAGVAFLDQLSAATGGAKIAAASHLVGAASGGGSWDLNVNVGSIDIGAPFTAAAEASVQGELPVATTGELFTAFLDGATPADQRLQENLLTGGTILGSAIDLLDETTNKTSFLSPTGVAIDAPLGQYVISDSDGGDVAEIIKGNIVGTPTLTVLVSLAATSHNIGDVVLDQPNGLVYFADAASTNSGIYSVSINATGPTTPTQVVVGHGMLNPADLALDPANHLIFFTDFADPGNDELGVYDTAKGTFATLNSQLGSITADIALGNGAVTGVAVDTATDTLYVSAFSDGGPADNYVFRAHYSVSGTGAVTLTSPTMMYSGTGIGQPEGLTIDPQNGVFYVGDFTNADFHEGSLSHTGGGGTLALITPTDTTSGTGIGVNAFLVTTPTIASGAGTSVTLDHVASVLSDPTATVNDQDGEGLGSATITVSGSFSAGDSLTAGAGFGAIFSGHSLALTNTQASLSAWQTELETVAFQTTSAVQSVRTLTWAASDGINPSNTFTTTVDVICFCVGTQIGTPAGQVPVETLKIGDMVLTAQNGERPVRWIGKGKVIATHGKRTAASTVIVRKDALADNVPNRDLHVTKAHSLCIDDVLIPVEFLVNYRTILWDERAGEAEIYHIELDSHDVLLANGAPAESFRDDGNRWLFQNANSGCDLPPQKACAPVLTGGPVVDAVWTRLLNRAGLGDIPPLTDDPDLHLIVDGARVDPVNRQGSRSVFRLPCCPGSVVIGSRTAVPAELGVARDPRPLGVAVRQVTVRQGAKYLLFDADDERLAAGFHDYEPSNDIRWTNGRGELPPEPFARFDKGAEVTLFLGGATRYPDERGRAEREAA